MAIDRKIKICHLTSVHRVTDSRIYWKECLSLCPIYSVYLVVPGIPTSYNEKVHFVNLPATKNRLVRFFITDLILLIKAILINAEVYHFHDPELIPSGIILKMLGKKVIYDVHENVSADLPSKKWLYFKKLTLTIYSWFEDFAAKNFYLILAEKSYEQLYVNRTTKIIVIQNYVKLDWLAPHSFRYNNKSNTLVLLGTLSARRGLPFILDAIWLLKQKKIEVRLKCIGEVNKEVLQILEDSSSYKQIKEQIEFTGYIGFGALVIWDCLAGLALPENLPNHYGSYPTKMFEYMAVGLPVISSDFELYKEVIEKYDCGIAVNPEDSQAIADAIEYLVLHPEKASSYSANAKEAVLHFDWKTEEKKLLDFYKMIID